MSQHDQGSGWSPPPPPPAGSPGEPTGWPEPGPPSGGWPSAPPAPVVTQPPATAPVGQPVRTMGWVLLGLAVMVAVAAFLPWVEAFGITVTGIGGDDVGGAKDGVLTLLLALPAGVLGLLRGLGKAPLGAAIVALVMGLLITLIALVDIADVNDIAELSGGGASVGVGLWLTLVGGLGLVAVGIAGIVRRR